MLDHILAFERSRAVFQINLHWQSSSNRAALDPRASCNGTVNYSADRNDHQMAHVPFSSLPFPIPSRGGQRAHSSCIADQQSSAA
jgi:hypothetical protein